MTRITLRPRALDGLRSVPRGDQARINAAIDILKQELFPSHTKKLEGTPYGYRTRVGRWWILFTLQENTADVADIFLKKERGDYRRRK